MIVNEFQSPLRKYPFLVSVIVLTYNHRRYICQALDSILMQRVNFNYEILVGDDASTDGTQEILKEYQKKYPDRFRIFLREKNVGASRNAYELLTDARGKYLASCEGDDYWTDLNKLQIQVDFLEGHSEFIGCVHDLRLIDENGMTLKRKKVEWIRKKKRFTLRDFQGYYLPGQLSTFVRRNIFLYSEYDFSIIYKAHPMVADRTSLFLYLHFGDVYRIDRVMSCYRSVIKKEGKNATSISFANNANRIREEYDILLCQEKYSQRVFHLPICFTKRKMGLFGESVMHWLWNPGEHTASIVKYIWNQADHKAAYCFYIPIVFCKKIIMRRKRIFDMKVS